MLCQQPGYFPEVREKTGASILAMPGPVPEILLTSNAKAYNDDLTQNPKGSSCYKGHLFQFLECVHEKSGQT